MIIFLQRTKVEVIGYGLRFSQTSFRGKIYANDRTNDFKIFIFYALLSQLRNNEITKSLVQEISSRHEWQLHKLKKRIAHKSTLQPRINNWFSGVSTFAMYTKLKTVFLGGRGGVDCVGKHANASSDADLQQVRVMVLPNYLSHRYLNSNITNTIQQN